MNPRFAIGFAAGLTLAALAPWSPAEAQTPTPFGAVVEVSRILTEVRVVDAHGEPVTGLGPEDFKVKVDGRPATVESVLWIPATEDAAIAHPDRATIGSNSPTTTPPTEGRLIVVLFQMDIQYHESRVSGLMRMAPYAAEFVSKLGPKDRVALLYFRSHLQLRADFTDDHRGLAEMLTTTEILAGRMDPPAPAGPSLAEFFDVDQAKAAASMARALELIGEALQEIPGAKSLVIFGYGLGTLSAGSHITIGDGYRRAMEALTAARASVFTLDITSADYHSLELGLRTVAADTGGAYWSTYVFPAIAMAQFTRVISSYYELEIIPPPDLGKNFSIKVKVDRPRVEVFVRQYHPSNYNW
jgi:VWFA-related protein